MVGDDGQPYYTRQLQAHSPDRLAAQLDLPIRLVHDDDDQRARIARVKAMHAALDAAHKPCKWLSKPAEGGGFYDEANTIEFYRRLESFLAKHLAEPGSK